MNFVFRVTYATVVGESLWLEVTMHHGAKVIPQILPMKWADEKHWEAGLEAGKLDDLEYRYVLKREDGLELVEFGNFRKWHHAVVTNQVLFLDDWKSAGSEDRVYETKVFEIADGQKRELCDISSTGNHELHLQMSRLSE